jgi:hypothetical protein
MWVYLRGFSTSGPPTTKAGKYLLPDLRALAGYGPALETLIRVRLCLGYSALCGWCG